jgi:hypothetical protein
VDGVLMLQCSTHGYHEKPVHHFYSKKVVFEEGKVFIHMNSNCHEINDYNKTESNPIFNPGHNKIASDQRDDVTSCYYPNCVIPCQENTKYCAAHQEQMGGYYAEVSPLTLLFFIFYKITQRKGEILFLPLGIL